MGLLPPRAPCECEATESLRGSIHCRYDLVPADIDEHDIAVREVLLAQARNRIAIDARIDNNHSANRETPTRPTAGPVVWVMGRRRRRGRRRLAAHRHGGDLVCHSAASAGGGLNSGSRDSLNLSTRRNLLGLVEDSWVARCRHLGSRPTCLALSRIVGLGVAGTWAPAPQSLPTDWTAAARGMDVIGICGTE